MFSGTREYVDTTVNTQYLITDQLNVTYDYYFYSIVASNCAGNSTEDYSHPVYIAFGGEYLLLLILGTLMEYYNISL